MSAREEAGPATAVRVIAGAAVILVAAVVAILLFTGGGGYRVTADFVNAGQLVKGSEVRVAGSTVGTVEDRPGIPPSPQHLVNLIRQMKEEKVKVILVEPWNDVKLANRVAEEAGAKAYVMATSVGAVKGADNYVAAIDFNINTLAKALR